MPTSAPPTEPKTVTTTTTLERPLADLKRMFPGRYLSITSFKRDGTGISTPVWFVCDGARLYAFTDLHSAKIRRMRHNPHVEIASCRPWGKLRQTPVSAHADVLTDTADLDCVRKLLLARYRISYRVVMFFYRLGRRVSGKQAVADGAALAITPELGLGT
jgi:uncharacterized protein